MDFFFPEKTSMASPLCVLYIKIKITKLRNINFLRFTPLFFSCSKTSKTVKLPRLTDLRDLSILSHSDYLRARAQLASAQCASARQ